MLTANKIMVELTGVSGKIYYFETYGYIPEHISNCVYIYARKEIDGYVPVYIGITERTFKERYAEHENDKSEERKESVNFCCGFHRAFDFLFLASPTFSKNELEFIEADLVSFYKPVCNIDGK